MPPFMSTAPRPYRTPSLTSASKGSARPGGRVAGRHHVGVAGETEVGRGGPAPGVEVLDPRLLALAARPLEGHAAAGEAQLGQDALQHVHGARVGGRHRGPADQVAASSTGSMTGVDAAPMRLCFRDVRGQPERGAPCRRSTSTTAPTGHGTGYPEEFAGPCKPRRRWKLGDAVGLDQFGVNLLRLPAGAWSSQRHWHQTEDEFVWVLSGEVVLVEDDGETVLTRRRLRGLQGRGPERPQDREPIRTPRRFCWRSARARPAATAADYPDIDMVLPARRRPLFPPRRNAVPEI